MECKERQHEFKINLFDDSIFIPVQQPTTINCTKFRLEDEIGNFFEKNSGSPSIPNFALHESKIKIKTKQTKIIANSLFIFVLFLENNKDVQVTASGTEQMEVEEEESKQNSFEIPLTLSKAMLGRGYDLHSIICRIENENHFYSLIKNTKTQEWFKFNDTKVSKFNLEDLNVRN